MKTCFVFLLSVALVLCVTPTPAQENVPGIEDEFSALIEQVGVLIKTLERQIQVETAARSLDRVGIATQLLDIRVRQQANLQEELLQIDNREQRIQNWVASSEIKLDNLDRQIAVAIDEGRRIELESKQNEIRQYLTNNKQELEHLTQRRLDLQGRIASSESRVQDVEDIVQDWLTESSDGDR